LFALAVRFVNPPIGYFSEQYMNQAFLASVIREPVVPPLDPWFAGGHLTVYYYLGHWLMGCLAIVTGIPSEVAFNLVPATVYGTAFVTLYAVGHLFLRRWRWVVLAVLLLVPPSVPWFLAAGGDLYQAFQDTNWIISGARFEFPVFSLFLGNVHAFEMAAFNQFLLIFLLGFAWCRWSGLDTRGRGVLVLLLALSIGSMPPMSSWDALVYGPAVMIVLVRLALRERDRFTVAAAVAVPAIAFLVYLPYYLALEPAGIGGIGTGFPPPIRSPSSRSGAGSLQSSTPPSSGTSGGSRSCLPSPYRSSSPATLPSGSFWCRSSTSSSGGSARSRTFSASSALRCSPSVRFSTSARCSAGLQPVQHHLQVLLRRLDPPRHRSLLLAGRWLAARRSVLPAASRRWLAVVAAAALIDAPFALQVDIGRGLLGIDYPQAGYDTLDGLAYLDATRPGEAAAIDFLRGLDGDQRIVEAENGDYGYYSRVSSFSGIPAVLGQIAHELTWGERGVVTDRPADIRAIYEDPDRTLALMAKYNATLLYVGESECERYDVRLPDRGLVPIYDEGEVRIYTLAG
jgi:uncharacterized membrane protein